MSDAKYYKIYFALIAMVALSAGLSYLGRAQWAIAALFAIAGAKAFLVLAYYMGLDRERAWVKWVLGLAVLCLVILVAGVAPDVVFAIRKAGG